MTRGTQRMRETKNAQIGPGGKDATRLGIEAPVTTKTVESPIVNVSEGSPTHRGKVEINQQNGGGAIRSGREKSAGMRVNR